MLTFAFITTSAISFVLGGTFSILGQGLTGVGQSVIQGQQPEIPPQILGREGETANPAAPIFTPGTPENQRMQETAAKRVSALIIASWWLFSSSLLSLIMSVWGGATGARKALRRRIPHVGRSAESA